MGALPTAEPSLGQSFDREVAAAIAMRSILKCAGSTLFLLVLSAMSNPAGAQDVWYPPGNSNVARGGAGSSGTDDAYRPAERETSGAARRGTFGLPPDDQVAVPGGRRAAPGAANGWSRRGPSGWQPNVSATAAPAIYGLPPSTSERSVERGNLTPVMSSDGSGLPYELWRGLDSDEIERLLGSLTIPPRSPAISDLWRRLITARAAPPPGAEADHRFEALRLEALYRSGLIGEIASELKDGDSGRVQPIVAMMQARSEIGLRNRERGCAIARQVGNISGEIPKSLRGEAILVSGYCAAANGNAAAAGLLAELAREEGVKSSAGLIALDAIAAGVTPEAASFDKQPMSLVDYRILELAHAAPPPDKLIANAAPALLASIAGDASAEPGLRLEAAEAAARLNVISAKDLGDIYRQSAAAETQGATSGTDSAARRAGLYLAASRERTPAKKVRLIRSLLDSARRADLYAPALGLVHVLSEDVGLAPEISWFAETAIEAHLAAADYAKARVWIRFAGSLDSGRGNLDHWMALADIADPDFPEQRGQSLNEVERLAHGGRLSADLLHRLATVLDALDYQVPIPLWEAASRTPQPNSGHLPETGVLSQLQQAAKERAFGRTVLLAMQALGPDGAEGAHIIALGDAIRALKRAGLETDARRLALEAVIGAWPRTLSN